MSLFPKKVEYPFNFLFEDKTNIWWTSCFLSWEHLLFHNIIDLTVLMLLYEKKTKLNDGIFIIIIF